MPATKRTKKNGRNVITAMNLSQAYPKEKTMNESIKELIAIGASVGAHCQPCLEYHIQAAIELGVREEDILQAVEVGHAVEKGAMAAMRDFSSAIVKELTVAAPQAILSSEQHESSSKGTAGGKVLKIYDPAMCCSSGVCGPSVDPALAQFAGALKFVSSQPGIQVERYNLGNQPQAFVENERVKTMLGNGGEKNSPLYLSMINFGVRGVILPRRNCFRFWALKPTRLQLPYRYSVRLALAAVRRDVADEIFY